MNASWWDGANIRARSEEGGEVVTVAVLELIAGDHCLYYGYVRFAKSNLILRRTPASIGIRRTRLKPLYSI